ncbi:unnamed protein product (macronuclear) [Paramecium tetraurelia]|uniref:Response regulatory domain-containing protein n=1 Tax=Paramecium tetraurelia TaxID=5888 RepID=A0E872_PARTE|nr:uncharacterized protein GSPATT00024217001 [Paramecium tetraurelia]CAK91489.1 unnamed protein product [Paramecium tetraurelia]|eukprot:XP_001458886.1 hypothetical protein (macronuclear) [Paramecium tetraurelia strain d4-2]
MYIKKLKHLISITIDDYRNEIYSAQHNQLIRQKIWPTFIALVKFYAIIGIIYVIIYNSLYFSTFNKPFTTFYFYIQFAAIVLYVAAIERIINCIRESYKLTLMIFTFILIETSFQTFLIEVYLDSEEENRPLTICQLFINLLLVLVIVRTIKLRIIILLKFYAYFLARGITFHFKTFQSVNILFFLILILYFWDQQLINLSKVSQFTDQTLKSIPSAVCVLDQNCQDVLFTNNFTKRLIQSLNYGGLSGGTKSINLAQQQGFPSQESILSSSSDEIVSFFENLTLPQSEVKEQFDPNRPESKFDSTDQHSINLNQAIALIMNLEQQTQGSIYTLRCQYENQNCGEEYPIIVEARIKTKLQYGFNKNAILLNLYDVSPNFKSSYYKKLNQFKSQVIRSISHELRTRLNVIQGFLQVIQCNSHNYDKEMNKLLRAAFNNCRIQNLIISSIINYNLIREKKLATKQDKCKLISVIQEAIDLFQEEAEMKNIKIQFQKQINQAQNEMLDYEKFQSIMIHIISNSIKFNNKSGQIFITITKENQEKEKDKLIFNKENDKKTLQPSCGSQLYKSSQDVNESSFHFPLRKGTAYKQQLINNSSSFSNAQPQQTNTHLYEYYLIEIRDNGMGIDQQKLEAIQNLLKNEEKAFQDLDRDSASGMMLGLRASNALIKYISGKEEDNYITIDSVLDQGTTVCIHLKCRITQLTEGFMPSDLYNKESSQIELEGNIPDIESQSYKFNIWTDPDISSRTNMISKTKKSSSNQMNMTNKKGSAQMFSINNISSFYKNMEGSLFKSITCTCAQKIVIVDDEPYNLLVLESLLKQLGYQSIKADNGKQCFDEHKCLGFKAIIMDYQMPIMNGQQATQKLQAIFQVSPRIQIPIFGLTGFSGEDDLINLIDAGMKQVYIKPITLKTLEEMINNLNLVECKDTPRLSSRQFQCFELNYAEDLEYYQLIYMQISNNSQQLALTKIQNTAFNVQYSPFRLLNIKYTEATTQRLIEEPINSIHAFQIQSSNYQEHFNTKNSKQPKGPKESVKVISIDLKLQKKRFRTSSKENLSDYQKKLINDIQKIEKEILNLS